MKTNAPLPEGLTPLINPDDISQTNEFIRLDQYTVNLYTMRAINTKSIDSAIQSIVASRKVSIESVIESIKSFIINNDIGHVNKTLTLSQITIIRKLIYKLYPHK